MNDLTTIRGLLAHIASIHIKLDENKISIDTAKAHAALSKQSNNLLRLEFDREKWDVKLKEIAGAKP